LNKASGKSEERSAPEGGFGSGKNVHAASFQPSTASATSTNPVSAALPSVLVALEFEKLKRFCEEERVLWEAEFYKGYFKDLIESDSFSVTGLKRASAKCWSQTRGHRTIKRDGRYIAEMFLLCQPDDVDDYSWLETCHRLRSNSAHVRHQKQQKD
jgi:hypothetical protein